MGYKLLLRGMDHEVTFEGTIGFGDSYLEILFRQFKVFGLNAKLLDAAGAVRVPSGKGPGNFYMIGQRTNSCLLCHVIGLLLSFYVKLYLPSIFNNSVDF